MRFAFCAERSKDIANLPKNYSRLVSQHIDDLQDDPRPPGAKKLRGSTDYRLRVGTYRILYDINDKSQTITVYRVKHRREAYR
ncbi:type II toxin-antitoxin system RelE/ParE family toxin [Candidatus Poribacteria bacterium]|nr:type II toxin-antitoxin system RelE/ParE family toxin [Candidatus Poribacteria bacterium]